MKIRKPLILLFLFLISLNAAFADDSSEKKGLFNKSDTFFHRSDELAPEDRTFLNTTSINFELTPGFYLNPNNENKGQTAASIYPFSLGFTWPNYTSISFAPSFSFFTMNHLFDNGTAYPAEIENRRSLTFNMIVNFPMNISFFLKKGTLQLAPGIMFLPRFAVLANGIGTSEELKSEVSQINQWFWKNARFLYLSTGFSYLINLSETVKGGPVVHAYIPVGTVFSGEGIQGMIVSFGMKIQM